jgi:hypothetical protein
MEQRNTVAKGSSSAPMFKLFPIPRFFGEEVQARAASFIGQDFRVARREWSSIAKCRYSRPTPRLYIWPLRSPGMRWPTCSKRQGFWTSMRAAPAGDGYQDC